MQDAHRTAIQRNFSSLVEQTDLDVMVSALYEKGVFSEQMIEPYKDTTKDARDRKRQMYMDLIRRGPLAFGLLLESLTEAGNWNLVRELDPESSLHSRLPRNHISTSNISNHRQGSSRSQENNYVSISTEKKKTKSEIENHESPKPEPTWIPPVPSEVPHFHVVKSTKFFEDNGSEFKLYRTRSKQRGVLLMFTYTEFADMSVRSGAEVDCRNLKYLFHEFGFKVVSYMNLTEKQTLETLQSLRDEKSRSKWHGAESVFVVVSSHGHEHADGSDVDVRCFHGHVSVYRFIEFFSNVNFPELVGKPKIFIFQICRGQRDNRLSQLQLRDSARGGAPRAEGVEGGEGAEGAQGTDGTPRTLPATHHEHYNRREYSDVLIAHSTVPGFVSYRDSRKGSWYIQTLCEVFAARAHERHVHDLLTLVDERLERTFRDQTSSIDKWGFNRRLYLHPGLFEDDGPDDADCT